jgi:GNAT superfamily N-acetyltransferase
VNTSYSFVELDKEVHDRDSFDCGEDELNGFIQQRASRHMDAGISTTRVLSAAQPLPNGKYLICSFYTVTPGAISRETLPISLQKKLPHYPIPILLIAQMAVHNEYKGKGLGKITLVKALEYLWNIDKQIRAYAVIVDCLNSNVITFYERYGFQKLMIIDGRTRMFMPMKTVGSLFKE